MASRHRSAVFLLTLACLLTILSALQVAPASAAPAGADQPVKLSLRPVGQPGAYFQLTLKPGQHQQLRVALGNNGPAPIRARTYAADAYSIINGGFGAKDRTSTPTGTTTWLSYPSAVLRLPAGRARVRTFTLTVPRRTTPGQYLTSLVLENNTPVRGSGHVALDQVIRQAVAVSIQVPGPRHPGFGFGSARHKITAARSVVDVQIHNSGNVNLKPAGDLTIRDDSGTAISKASVTMGSLYAHNSTWVQTTLADKLKPGHYTLDITLTDPDTKATASGKSLPFTVAQETANTSTGPQQGHLPTVLQDSGTSISTYLLIAAALLLLAILALYLRHIHGRRTTPRHASNRLAPAAAAQDSGVED